MTGLFRQIWLLSLPTEHLQTWPNLSNCRSTTSYLSCLIVSNSFTTEIWPRTGSRSSRSKHWLDFRHSNCCWSWKEFPETFSLNACLLVFRYINDNLLSHIHPLALLDLKSLASVYVNASGLEHPLTAYWSASNSYAGNNSLQNTSAFDVLVPLKLLFGDCVFDVAYLFSQFLF